MNKMKRMAAMLAFSILTMMVNAQPATGSGDVMRSNGKIYVVVAVIVTIVIGLFIYLLTLDRKISRIEKK